MRDIEKLCGVIEEELQKISDKGLNTGNLETAYKLIDMYKDLKNTKYWDRKEEYYTALLEEMQGGYSERRYDHDGEYSMRKRDRYGRYSREGAEGYDNNNSYARRGEHYVRGHYSRDGYSHNNGLDDYNENYGRYMDSKQSYRSNKSPECKQRLMESLEGYMDDFTGKIKEMHRDADTPEEREMITKFMNKLQNIR